MIQQPQQVSPQIIYIQVQTSKTIKTNKDSSKINKKTNC